jgi:hypothetical protein
VLDERL